jgi:acyl carrier protein
MTMSLACMVNRIVARHLDVDPAILGPGLTFAKLGASDITMIHLVMAVEDACDAEASDEDAEQVKTVGDLHRLAGRLAGERVEVAA